MVELVEMFGVREEVYNVGAEVVAGAWCYGESSKASRSQSNAERFLKQQKFVVVILIVGFAVVPFVYRPHN